MRAFPTALLIEQPLILASLYDLAAIVFGSESLARRSTGDDDDEFDKLRVRHEVAQATKLLIEAAVVLRNLLDGGSWPLDLIRQVRIDASPQFQVGGIREGDREEKTLGFRDACNKVIHAKSVSFGMKESESRLAHLDGTIELHGERRGKAWVANIDVAMFIRMAVRQLS